MLESIVELCRESRKLTIARTGFERPCVSHQRLVEAIGRRNAAAAAEAMRQHLEYTRSDLAAQLAKPAAASEECPEHDRA